MTSPTEHVDGVAVIDGKPTLTKLGMEKLAAVAALAAQPLHEIVDAMLDAFSDAIDPETGEVRPDFETALDALGLALERKVEVYAAINERLRAEGDALRDLSQRYAKKAGARENAAKRLRSRLQQEMERLGMDRVKTQTTTAALQKSAPSVELHVLDAESIPDEFVMVERKPDLKKIAETLKAGAALTWASLRQSQHLRFR